MLQYIPMVTFQYILSWERNLQNVLKYVTVCEIVMKNAKIPLITSKYFCGHTEGFSGGECHEVMTYGPDNWIFLVGDQRVTWWEHQAYYLTHA